jgi:DNA-binding CsgD family transcriptional regulator/PAS domain-containing protein
MTNWNKHIGDLYNGVLDNALWTQAVARIMEEAGANKCLLLCPYISPSTDTPHTMECLDYKDCCPFFEDVHPQHDDLSECSDETGCRPCAILLDGRTLIDRSHDHDDGVNDRRILDQQFSDMLPHLQRALHIRWQMVESHDACSLREEALDSVPQALVLLNETGHVLFANRGAKAILQKEAGPIIANNRLTARNARSAGGIKDALALAARGVNNSIKLEDSHGQQRWVAVFNPLHMSSSHNAPATRILVLIANLEQVSYEGLLHFAKLYGLTPAESRVLQQLLVQQSTQDIAKTLDISIKTLRIHLGNLFAKTACSSQRELVRFFMVHPAVNLEPTEE